jgi:tRNA uridine 5-carboxymethylaminomethyl modification enzyme
MLDPDAAEQVEIDAKYAGYVQRAARRAEAEVRLDHVALPAIDWRAVDALSWEVRERLVRHAPRTLGQMRRLPGVTPAAVDTVAALLSRL